MKRVKIGKGNEVKEKMEDIDINKKN